MTLLLLVSIIWAFSFGLVKGQLAGLDPTLVAVLRLSLSLLVFLPFARWRAVPGAARWRFIAIGALQFGAMYLFYLRAYAYLAAYEVALFTIITPLYIVTLDAIMERRWETRFMLAALVAAIGAAIVIYTAPHSPRLLTGFLLVQGSDFCFALGQLLWRRERARFANGLSDAQLFALPYAGAVALTLIASGFTTPWSQLADMTLSQFGTIAYLGIVASGLCFFWWNVGARQVNAGVLAALNNAKVPLGVACSLLFFGEHAELPLLVLSLTLLGGALWIAGRKK